MGNSLAILIRTLQKQGVLPINKKKSNKIIVEFDRKKITGWCKKNCDVATRCFATEKEAEQECRRRNGK